MLLQVSRRPDAVKITDSQTASVTRPAFPQDDAKSGRNDEKRIAKNKYIFGAIEAVCTDACGIIYDNVRNKKAKEVAESVRQLGTKGAIENNSNATLSRRGHVYYEASDGLKLGGVMGAGCGLMHGAMNAPKRPVEWLASMITFGLGGMLLGKIADSNSNNEARKNV